MRNTIKNIGIFCATVLIASSCNKILDQEIQGSFTPDNYFTSDANAVLALNAAYRPLAFTSGSSNAVWVLGDVASDDAIKGGNEGDQADFDAVDKFNILPTNSAVEAVWTNYYNGVFYSNVVLDGLPESNSAVTPATRRSVVAQAKFLRAYYYFVLTNAYGNIPLRLKVESGSDAHTPASSQDAIYTQIEKDCLEALPDLPATGEAEFGRATKGAAQALLAKTYLFHTALANHYTLAIQAAEAVESMGYSLTQRYYDNFSASTKNNTEAIFTVNHTTGTLGIGNELNAWFAPRSINGYGFFWPTQSLVDNYETGTNGDVDPRLDYTVGRNGHNYFETAFDPSWSTTGYVTKKMVQPLSEVPTATKNVGSVNYEALRLADILLVKAEALNESGRSSEALAPLNAIRKRARESFLYDASLPGAPNIPAGLLPDINTTDQTQLRAIIRRERRSELALEFQRFFDVIRYGSTYATSALTPDAPGFNYETNKWFPIPQSERDANPAL
ncbi:MAG: RagB/SusD family nutrient uptake outer membrane protein [Candidatus Pseudobacter hemicellulosilyticus]|uniref:RagB/SusD family nutrient uptake outer membrane protein n=1 Tax=Candidatus Pseudobacter hemicellulosilyticus TaxID=3121375 RepID=A0AAJ6BFR1_9BACT|nr:MAG: RagB/SusD family nutrient uptake outer membrane protein [Pseudobacter sp.]